MKSEKRVAFCAAGSGNRGGTGVYVQRLLSGFRREEFKWIVPLGVGGKALPTRLFQEYGSIPLKAARMGFSAFHLPSFAGGVPIGVKLIVTVHDLAFLAEPAWFPPLKRMYYRLFFPAVARKAHKIIVDSDFTGAEAVRLLGVSPEKVRRVYLSHGSPDGNHLPEFRREWGIHGDYAVCVCTMEPRKNIASLLDAWRIVIGLRPDARLVLAGRWGWGTSTLRDALRSRKGVIWTGSLSRSMLTAAIAGARLLVYPSVYEGFGLPPLEAASLGVPSVLGPAGALREIYRGVARFSGGDPGSLAAALLEEFDTAPDPSSLKDFASAFTDGAMAVNTAAVYRECIE